MTEEHPAEQEELTPDAEEESQEELDEQAKLKEAIEVESEEVGTLRRKLTITVPRDYLDDRLNDQFAELKRESIVPGFRRGRAPLRLVEKRFGSEVGDQLVGQIVGGSYMAAVEKEDLKPLGDPLVWVEAPAESEEAGRRSKETTERLMPLEKALDHMKLPSEGPMTFSCEVELRPEFELPELDKIPVEKPKIEFTEDDVQREIDRYRAQRGHYVPVEEPIEVDDLIVADVTQKVGGKVVKEEKNVNLSARPQRVDGIALEDFGEALKGKKAGETVTVETTIPEDHETLDWRGNKAEFDVTIQDVKRLELPPLDAEFLESVGFDSEEDLRAFVRSTLESQLDSLVRQGMRGQIGKYLLENTHIEVPEDLTRRQTDRLVTRRMIELYQRGLPEEMVKKQLDELQVKAGEDAANELKLFFIMEKIAEQMDIEVPDDELNGEIARIARRQGKRFDRVRDELAKGGGLTGLYLQLRDDKILDELLRNAVVTEVERPKKKDESATPEEESEEKSEE